MAAMNHLEEILLALADAGVRFVVAGGVAAVLHGVERATMDLDLSVAFDEDNLRRFLRVMEALTMLPRAPVPAELLLDPAAVEMMVRDKGAVVFTFLDPARPYRQVDVFLLPELGHGVLSADATTASIRGRAVPVVSIRTLIALKRRVDPPRDKDRWDLGVLARLLGEEE